MKNLNIQEYLSLGYIYLLILGILSDTVYYNMIGINILDYSGISDVLLSPLKLVANNMLILIILIFIIAALFAYNKWLYPYLLKRAGKASAEPATVDKLLTAAAIMIMFFFLGIGIGMGIGTSKSLKTGRLKANYEVTFANSTKKQIRLLGRNSLFLFYSEPGGKNVIAASIGGNVLEIRKLN